jgi:hypothetical protein
MRLLIAAGVGCGGGIFAGWLVYSLLASTIGLTTTAAILMVGAILGGFVGALVAAILGSDPDAASDSSAPAAILGFFLGCIGGLLGSSRFEIIDWILNRLR